MIANTKVNNHSIKVIKTLDKIVNILTKSTFCEQDKKKLVELGKNHFHYGLKQEHFKV